MSKIEITVKPEGSAIERARDIARAIDQGKTIPTSRQQIDTILL